MKLATIILIVTAAAAMILVALAAVKADALPLPKPPTAVCAAQLLERGMGQLNSKGQVTCFRCYLRG